MYLASSVVRSLNNNKFLSITGLGMVTCPVVSCVARPEECSKGQKQLCTKKIDIVYEHDGHNKVVFLVFYYQLKGHIKEGFIRKDDLALNILLKREIIKKKALTISGQDFQAELF
jgi:hypothetical protein